MPVDMLQRVGSLEFGTFLVNPANLYKDGNCLVYTFSTQENYFESALVEYTNQDCEIHKFDLNQEDQIAYQMTLSGEIVKIHVHQNWIAVKSDQSGVYDSLLGFMERFGHLGRTINVLKVDCEECEFEVFPKIFEDIAKKKINIGIISVMLHDKNNKNQKDIKRFFQEADKSSMRLYGRDPNLPQCDG